jgi:hypothetical protein
MISPRTGGVTVKIFAEFGLNPTFYRNKHWFEFVARPGFIAMRLFLPC